MPTQTLRTEGIVIKRSNIGEADRILTIITERLGKVKAIAKGVRKIKSKMAGSLEPYMLLELELHEGKTFFTVTGAKIISQFQNIHSDIKKTAQAYFVGELLDKFLEEDQKTQSIFDLARLTFTAIEADQKNLIILAFQLKMVEEAGFKPEIMNCIHCKEKLLPGNNFWDHIEGGVICQNCQEKYHHGENISDGAIKALRFIEKNSYREIEKLKISKTIENELDKILLDYVRGILERDIKSVKFLNRVS